MQRHQSWALAQFIEPLHCLHQSGQVCSSTCSSMRLSGHKTRHLYTKAKMATPSTPSTPTRVLRSAHSHMRSLARTARPALQPYGIVSALGSRSAQGSCYADRVQQHLKGLYSTNKLAFALMLTNNSLDLLLTALNEHNNRHDLEYTCQSDPCTAKQTPEKVV